jgi:DNA-binding transcriptional ArsR family regulator
MHNHVVVDTLNLTFLALSDPTRRVILERLRNGAATVNELAEPFGVSQQAISKHLAYLERASLIEKRKEGRQQFCSLRAAPLKGAYDWMAGYQQFWDEAPRCAAEEGEATPWPQESLKTPARSASSACSTPRATSCSMPGRNPSA